MKVILHMSVSLDGYVATKDGNSDWVSPVDEKLFTKRCKQAGCVIVGIKTYEQYKSEIYPVKGTLTIVLTRKSQKSEDKNIVFIASPQEALEFAKEKTFETVIIAGGAKVSGLFLKEKLLDEIFLTIHPLVLGEGMRLFEGLAEKVKFKLLDSRELEDGLVECHYIVK